MTWTVAPDALAAAVPHSWVWTSPTCGRLCASSHARMSDAATLHLSDGRTATFRLPLALILDARRSRLMDMKRQMADRLRQPSRKILRCAERNLPHFVFGATGASAARPRSRPAMWAARSRGVQAGVAKQGAAITPSGVGALSFAVNRPVIARC